MPTVGDGEHLPAASSPRGRPALPRDRHLPIGAREASVREGTHRLRIGDGEIRVRVRGRGPRLLMLHGLTAHSGTWRPVARRLGDRFTLVMPDLLSRGRSEARPDLPHDLDRELARIRAVARATGTVGRPVIGHSQGAALAAAWTGGPDPPPALVLVCPVTPWTRRPAALGPLRSPALRRAIAPLAVRLRRPVCRWTLRHRVFADPERVDGRTVRRYAAPWSERRRARALLRVLADWRPRELAGRPSGSAPPCRVVAGAHDRRVPVGEARRWARRLGAGLEVVDDAAHMVPVEAPGAVVRATMEMRRPHRSREERG